VDNRIKQEGAKGKQGDISKRIETHLITSGGKCAIFKTHVYRMIYHNNNNKHKIEAIKAEMQTLKF